MYMYLDTGGVDVVVTGCPAQVSGMEGACMFHEPYHHCLVQRPSTGLYQPSHVQLQGRVGLSG